MVTIYTIAYNEEIMLPFMIKWYRERFPNCEIVIYDNYSTDKTEQIALENNCVIIKYDSNNEIRDDLYLEIKNNCWKTATTDWVLVCDVDEFLDINEYDLKNEENNETTIIKSKGYDIVNLEDNYNVDNMNCGCNSPGYSKNYLFNKLYIREINYDAGCHISKPIGKIKYSQKAYNLFHNKYVNVDYLVERHKNYAKRLSSKNKQYGWGNHYFIKENIIREDFLQRRIHCKPITKTNKKVEHNYKKIEGWFNMEDQYLELLESTPENGIFVELGAYKGKSTSFIVTEIINRDRNINFYTIDTFLGDSGSTDEKEIQAYKQVNISKMHEEFIENTKHLNSSFKTIISKSNEAAQLFENNSVDAVFIDAGHSYEAVIADINAWLPKMKNGSIMAGHDYTSWLGVGKAVREVFGIPDKVENDCWFIKIKKYETI